MINFNLFVLPFFLGLIYVVVAIGQNWYRWIKALPAVDKVRFIAGIRHPKQVLSALKEVVLEGIFTAACGNTTHFWVTCIQVSR